MAGHTVPHSVKPVLRREAVYGAGDVGNFHRHRPDQEWAGAAWDRNRAGGAVHWRGSESFPATKKKSV